MAQPKILKWLQKGIERFVDPDREERLNSWIVLVHRELIKLKQDFNLDAAMEQASVDDRDQRTVAEGVYLRCLDRAWQDGSVTDKELKSLNWIAEIVRVPPTRFQQLNLDRASTVFSGAFATALEDGELNDSEAQQLGMISRTCGLTVQQMVRRCFFSEGEAYLRSIFGRIVADGTIDSEEWTRFCETVKRLGISWNELLEMIAHPVRQYVEHTLADCKSDENISPQEEAFLNWLLVNLVNHDGLKAYVLQEVAETKLFAEIASGRLPSVNAPRGVALRAGEVVHFNGAATYSSTKMRASGPKTETHSGLAVITDDRIMFSSTYASFQIIHRKVLGVNVRTRSISIQCQGVGAGDYQFPGNQRLAAAIWEVAIGRANQTIVDRNTSRHSRHIPRDVRQRVYQRYGGRCVECQAEQYLEFDHIIPVARGGSNEDGNIQLLCRKCNLSKSDNI